MVHTHGLRQRLALVMEGRLRVLEPILLRELKKVRVSLDEARLLGLVVLLSLVLLDLLLEQILLGDLRVAFY